MNVDDTVRIVDDNGSRSSSTSGPADDSSVLCSGLACLSADPIARPTISQQVYLSGQLSGMHVFSGQQVLPGQPVPSGHETTLPKAVDAMTLSDRVPVNWNMDTGAISHLNNSVYSLSDVFNMCIYPSVSVDDGYSITVTNSFHSVLPIPHRPLHLSNVLVTPNIVKDIMTHRVLLRSDSTRGLYPSMTPSTVPHDFLTKDPDLSFQQTRLAVGTTSLPVGTSRPAVGMDPLPVGTSIAALAKTVAASIVVRTVAISFVSSLYPADTESRQFINFLLHAALFSSRGSNHWASLPLTDISQRRCRLICCWWKSRGLSNPSSSGILPDGSCFRWGNSGNGDSCFENAVHGSENLGSLFRCFDPSSRPKLSDMGNAYQFQLATQNFEEGPELFQEILQIALWVPNQEFVELPSHDELLSFVKQLGYKGCLSGKSSGNYRSRQARVQILWDYKEEIDDHEVQPLTQRSTGVMIGRKDLKKIGKEALDHSQKLKGIETLFDVAQLILDTKKETKASKLEYQPQQQSIGSVKGIDSDNETDKEIKDAKNDESKKAEEEHADDKQDEDEELVDVQAGHEQAKEPIEPKIQSMVDVLINQEDPAIRRTPLIDTASSMVTEKTTSTPTQTPPKIETQVTLASESDPSLKFEQILYKLEKKVQPLSKIDYFKMTKESVQANVTNEFRNEVPKCLPQVVSDFIKPRIESTPGSNLKDKTQSKPSSTDSFVNEEETIHDVALETDQSMDAKEDEVVNVEENLQDDVASKQDKSTCSSNLPDQKL
uniref:Ribonuclease H-like domain-containing protein n=1 Tax=Tanacetum cinerariifolium TaxID=118510 RepID=A0A6L2J699_TANCI|nr:ribonuclease H-like domain-containing protein [Tanacetum cinerariifolium]